MVGLVVKYAGGIAKGFALIVGMHALLLYDGSFYEISIYHCNIGIIITTFVQWYIFDKPLTFSTW